MKSETSTPPTTVDPCCSSGCSSTAAVVPAATSSPGQGKLFRIATMDCSAEESEIRRALEPLEGIRSLGFQLGARTLKIDAEDRALPLALDAIRKAGKDLSREKLLTSLEGMQNHDLGGYRISYSANDRFGSRFVDLTVIGNSGRVLR